MHTQNLCNIRLTQQFIPTLAAHLNGLSTLHLPNPQFNFNYFKYLVNRLRSSDFKI